MKNRLENGSENRRFFPDRRAVLGTLGGAALVPVLGRRLAAEAGSALPLTLKPGTIGLGSGGSDAPIWLLDTADSSFISRVKQGADLAVSLANESGAPAALVCRGLDGAATAAALTAQSPIPAGGRTALTLPLRHAGTFLLDPGLLGDGAERPALGSVLIAAEAEPPQADRDEVLLIEDWRIDGTGKALAPSRATDAEPRFTINRKPTLDIHLKPNERLRLRVINGCHRAMIAVKIASHDVRVIAIDSQPAEPFLARDGQLVLAPGTRIDALLDATQSPGSTVDILLHDGRTPRPIGKIVTSKDAAVRAAPLPPPAPLPTTGQPARPDLRNALRVDVPLDPAASWTVPAKFDRSSQPTFKARRGRTVVLALKNTTASAQVVRLHGHHVRLLDKLDDGWKPFWLDTLALQPGETQRVACVAEFTGKWLIESVAPIWQAPRLVRWFAVD
jgi:FtsP/CotA-like multicopper oxidase with cupredoxin domain